MESDEFIGQHPKARSRTGPILLMIVGLILSTGPIWGFLATLVLMVKSFAEMDITPSPESLAAGVQLTTTITIACLAVAPLGIAAVILAILWLSRRTR